VFSEYVCISELHWTFYLFFFPSCFHVLIIVLLFIKAFNPRWCAVFRGPDVFPFYAIGPAPLCNLFHTSEVKLAVHAAGGGSASNESVETSKGPTHASQSAARKRGGDDVQIKGKNTFAVPRNVRALGWTANKPKTEEGDEKPKSNDEFRKMFMKN
jgi:hypothetical protein